MLTVTVELLHGTLRADPSGLAHTGRLVEGEWPPSPLRLFAAFVAADGTRDRRRVTTGDELAFLEAAPPPTIEATPPHEVHHQVLQPRYVVRQTGKAERGAHQEYQGRTGSQVRPGVKMSPRSPQVTYRWELDVPAAVLAGLEARAARIGYLGTADSPVAVTVSTDDPVHTASHGTWAAAADGPSVIRVPQPGVLAAMDAHHDRWMAEGPAVQRSQSPGLRRLARYRPPGMGAVEDEARPTPIWLRFERPVSGRRVTAVATALKAATLDLYQRTFGDPPADLHGHVEDPRRPHELAMFVPLPEVGHDHARGAIHGAVVVLPPETASEALEAVRTVLHRLTDLRGPGFATTSRPWAGERRPAAAAPHRWLGKPSTRFATAFPALHERRGVALTLTELARWCEHAGLPPPVSARSGRAPFLRGAVDLVPREVNRPGKAPRPYSHLELTFERPVDTLVVIGAGRTRGLGLCAPVLGAAR